MEHSTKNNYEIIYKNILNIVDVLSWLWGPEKMKLEVSYFQTFRLRLEYSSVRIYFYKK